MTLKEAKIGGMYEVQNMNLPRATKMRLTALGMTYGTTLSVLNNKHGGTVIFKVRGTRLAVGRPISKEIEVKEVSST